MAAAAPGLRETLTAILTREEGERLFVYDDATGKNIRPGTLVVGHPTIGYGRALDVRGISHERALSMLDDDITLALEDVPPLVPSWPQLSVNRQAVLAAMAFQLGANGLAGFRQMRARIGAGDFAGAAACMLDSLWARQTPQRALRMAELMRKG